VGTVLIYARGISGAMCVSFRDLSLPSEINMLSTTIKHRNWRLTSAFPSDCRKFNMPVFASQQLTYGLLYLLHPCSSVVCSQSVPDLFPVFPTAPLWAEPLDETVLNGHQPVISTLARRAEAHFNKGGKLLRKSLTHLAAS
jgi:hypothetical protein